MTDPTLDYNTPPMRRPAGQYVLPVSGACVLIGFLMMICSPLTALSLSSPPMPPEIAAMSPDDRPPPPPVRTIDMVSVVVLFVLGTLGTVGGVLGLARLIIGRWAMLAFCPLTLAYLGINVGYKLTRVGEDISSTAPTASAASLFYVCSGGILLVTVLVLILSFLYLLKPEVAATFRAVTFGDPDDRPL